MTTVKHPGWGPDKSNGMVISIMALLTAALFAVDIHFPPGVLDGIGYPSVMIFTLWLPGRRIIVAAAAFFSLLTVIAYTLLQPGGIGDANIANRAFALVLVWLVAGLINHRKVSDMRLRDALARAEVASAAKSKFLATLSHELRTPLNAILGFSDTLLVELFGPLGPPRNKECIKHINGSAHHLLALISDLLDFANLEQNTYTVEIKNFDLCPHLQKVIKAAEPSAANAQITLHWEVPEGLLLVRGDERLVEQTLRNLIDNALKFTRPGGWIELHGGIADAMVWIEIRDNGIGIPEETLRLIGQPFVRAADPANSSPGGTGLGLAIAKAFTEQQHGTLLVKSQPTLGTTVRVSYPCAPRGSGAAPT